MVLVLERAIERMLPSSGWDTFSFFPALLVSKEFLFISNVGLVL